MQDDIDQAVEEQSMQLLKAALRRLHACPGDHALHEAARQGNAPAIRLLLQGRANPNETCLCLERGCEFPLQVVALCASLMGATERCEAVESLLRAGARPNVHRIDEEANTPLHDAVRQGDLGVIRVLLRHSADPNVTNEFGETPLAFAVRLGPREAAPGVGGYMLGASPTEIAEALLNAGASPLSVDASTLELHASVLEPELRALIVQWSRWWRCRTLAWIRSRGQGHPICGLVPELMVHVGQFL